MSSQLLNKLQVVQNAATRLVTGTRRSEHMTPVLRDLHWLPIRQRVTFKTAVLAYKCQHGMAPLYLWEYASRCHLSSAASIDPRTLVDCLFHEPGRITAIAVSQYRDLGRRTIFLLTLKPQTFQLKHSDIN